MLENMLDYLRIALYAVLIMLGFMLYQAWDKDHPVLVLSPVSQTADVPASRYAPPVTETSAVASTAIVPSALPPVSQGKFISVTTDVLQISIDTHGGDIMEVKLPKYPETLGSKTPFLLLNDQPATRYIAESGLLSKQGPDTNKEQAVYSSAQSSYELKPGEKELVVTFFWQNKDGLKVTKTFTFVRDSYEVKVGYEIENKTRKPWKGNLYTQLMRTNTPASNHQGLASLTTYFGAAISSPQKPFQKITFKEMQRQNLSQTIPDGWVAMIQHYFVSAWIPAKTAVSTYYSRLTNGLYTIGMMGPELAAAPGSKIVTQAKLYTGPSMTDRLEKAAPGLQLTIDYGWFWFISVALFWMMQKIYDVVGNWGWSIVLVTVIIKLLFYHLSAKSYRSMSALKKLQPRIEALKERYGDDRQKLTQATLDLYRQEKVNPMGGCLPILIQIPVFIALYWVLVESVQLRQSPFIFWIQDLSQHDPYYVLPLLMGLSMFFQQRLNPPPPDPMQAKIMMFMPIIFTILFLQFPAGLMLYWFVNNTLSFLQQWYIMHSIGKEEKVGKKAK